MKRYFQGGSVAAYQHVAMLKLHYKIARVLDEGLASLEYDETPNALTCRLLESVNGGGGLHFTKLDTPKAIDQTLSISTTSPATSLSDGPKSNDEYGTGGFNGIDRPINPVRQSFLVE